VSSHLFARLPAYGAGQTPEVAGLPLATGTKAGPRSATRADTLAAELVKALPPPSDQNMASVTATLPRCCRKLARPESGMEIDYQP